MDGFGTDFFKIFATHNEKDDNGNDIMNKFAVLITSALTECFSRPENLPTSMSQVLISLIYKEKGCRNEFINYRPIAVMSVLYKIATRAMSDAIQNKPYHM